MTAVNVHDSTIYLAKKADIPFVPLTLPPFNYSYNQGKPSWTEEKEAIRTAFNQWLMTQENTIDINDMVRDPSNHWQVLVEGVVHDTVAASH